jgi:uncharacterized membrane protein YGL010W
MAASLFRSADDLMVQYARYHRDRRNIATHFFGIPLIVFAITVLMGRVSFDLAGSHVTLAAAFWAVTTAWYLTRGRLALGLGVSLVNGVLVLLAHPVATGTSASVWLATGVGTFVFGWFLQFIGHYYEGRKPAFVDDLVGLLVGPMFVTGEAMFAAGLCQPLAETIERAAGPTHLRDLAHPVA